MRCGNPPIFYLEIHGQPWENRWSITSFCSNSAEMGTFTCLPLFFVPFLCRCSLADDIRHEGACLKKLKSFRESRRCLALQRRSWHSTIVPTYSTIVPTFEQKCFAKNAQPQAGCVKHRCLTDIERQRCLFLQVVGRQSFWDLLQDLSEFCEAARICLRHVRAESRHTWCVCGIFGITIKALCKAARMHERYVRIRIADFVMHTFVSRKEKAASWWQKCGIMVR